jgi:hypothetical protein
MHQVVGGVAAGEHCTQLLAVRDVCAPAVGPIESWSVTGDRRHIVSVRDKSRDEASANETARTGDEQVHVSHLAVDAGHWVHERSTFAKISHASSDFAPRLSAM